MINYNGLTSQTFKAFKGHDAYKRFYQPIVEMVNKSTINKKDINVDNLINILSVLLKECEKDKIIDSCYIIINDLINNISIGGKSLTENEDKNFFNNLKSELLSKFQNDLEEFNETLIDSINSNTTQQQQQQLQQHQTQTLIIHETQNSQETTPNDQNQLNQLNFDNMSIITFLRQLAREEASQVLSKQNNTLQVSSNVINNNNNNNKKLTMSEVNNIRQQAYKKYEKLTKTEHHLSMFKTHIEQKTVPKALNYDSFPKPFFSDDPIYVDEHNKIINEAQIKIKNALVDRCTNIINATNIELIELKSTLDTYEGNKERFFDNVKSTVTNDLKQFLDAGNQKLLRLTKNYFEDHLATEYEVTEKTTDDFQQNYLSLSNENDIQYQTKPKYVHNDKDNDNSYKKIKKRNTKNNFNNTNSYNNSNNYNSYDYQYKKPKQQQKNSEYYYQKQNQENNNKKSKQHINQSDVNFRMATNQPEKG